MEQPTTTGKKKNNDKKEETNLSPNKTPSPKNQPDKKVEINFPMENDEDDFTIRQNQKQDERYSYKETSYFINY